jgi:3-isopropylmalate/(R)-2-methylmalate dehydratase large subunit
VPSTLAEKILASHAGVKEAHPGDILIVPVSLIMTNEVSGSLAIQEFLRIGVKNVFDPKRIIMVPDHNAPSRNVASAELIKQVREFCREQGILFPDVGRMGIEHVLIPELGLVLPGDIAIGGDSHTIAWGALGAFATGMGSTDIAAAMATGDTFLKVPPTIRIVYRGKARKWVMGKDFILHMLGNIGVDGATYSAIEFTGEAIDNLSMEGRFTMALMAVEAGAKAGLFRVDDKTENFIRPRATRAYRAFEPDPDAHYERTIEFDVSNLEPLVALPHSPANGKPISEIGNVKVDQVIIGCCTNGRLEDLQVAAGILKGRKVHPQIRCIVIPATQEIYLNALRAGFIETFIRAEAAVSTPTCGPCVGCHMGIIADGERCLATTNRNFVGRMGGTKSEIFLSNPAVAAASAVMGRIGSPEELD